MLLAPGADLHLTISLIIAASAMPLIRPCTSLIYWIFRGKMRLGPD